MFADRFSAAETTIASALAEPREIRTEVALLATRVLLSLPIEHRHLVRSLVAHANLPGHEPSVPATRLRAGMIRRWTTTLGTGGGRAARARVWALLQAIFGLGDLVDAGELSNDDALGQFATLLRAALSPAS